jgi:flagellar protein FliL
MAKEEAPVAEEAVPKRKGKLLIIILAAAGVVVIGAAVVAYLLLSKPDAEQGAKHGEDAEQAAEEHPPIYEKLEAFTVRLADQESYLQTEIQLLVEDAKVQERIKARLPEVRDALIRLLSSKTAEELSQQEGMDKLGEEVQKQVNELLGIKGKSQGVKKVLFATFIIQ